MEENRASRTIHKSYPRRGETYLTALDPALGHEIKKTRPALIIQNDISNQYSSTTMVAATVRLDQLCGPPTVLKRFGEVDAASVPCL